MSNIEWFHGWARRHFARHAETAPDPDTEDGAERMEIVRRQWDRIGITRSEADELTDQMATVLRLTARDHVPRLMDLAKKLTGNRPTQGVYGDRAAAVDKSRNCVSCGGEGLTSRRFPTAVHPEGVRLTCYCHVCVMGRWLKQAHASEPSLVGRIIDLADPRYAHLWDESPH